jgi:hypothetical protein
MAIRQEITVLAETEPSYQLFLLLGVYQTGGAPEVNPGD